MTTDYTIKKQGDFSQGFSYLIDQAINKAEQGSHKLNDFILTMEGMSGKNYRKFINNLIETLKDSRYLEVGSLKGSTSCSAMFKNTTKVRCIDNWHWNWKKEFENNTSQVVNENIDFGFIESDFRAVDYKNIGKFNVYMFDGPHTARDQYDGVYYAQPALDDYHILIVDDWNWPEVKQGTINALKFLEAKVESSIEIETHNYSDSNGNQNSLWHNGYFIAVIRK